MSDDVLVSIVDDDESVRESIPDLLRAFGFSARAFSSAGRRSLAPSRRRLTTEATTGGCVIPEVCGCRSTPQTPGPGK